MRRKKERITIKSEEEIRLMREAGKILAEVHNRLGEIIEPGISTLEIDRKGEEWIRAFGSIPSFLNYEGYPASICVSLDDEVVHGIPKENVILREGDIVSLDAGVIYRGYHSDAARTHAVGKISENDQKLIEVTKQSFFEGIKYAVKGNRVGDISHAIGEFVNKNGYSVVREFEGHGIGRKMHEDPGIPNYGKSGRGIRLEPGMTLAVEPMVIMGKPDILQLDDGWTIVTEDGSYSAHYENTILITEKEPEVLTLL